MYNTAVVKVEDKRMFSGYAQINECGSIAEITVKNKIRALKKLLRKVECEHFIVSHSQKNERIFENKIKRYTNLSNETILPLIGSICRLTAQKYGVGIPFEEVYIIADEETAFEIIRKLAGMSRLFSVISENFQISTSDRLYYEYGCISRRIKNFEGCIKKDCLVIRAKKKEVPLFGDVPMVDFTYETSWNNKVVSVGNIAVYDKKIEVPSTVWGGESNLLFYDVLGVIPEENVSIDINKKGDSIFLLDRETF